MFKKFSVALLVTMFVVATPAAFAHDAGEEVQAVAVAAEATAVVAPVEAKAESVKSEIAAPVAVAPAAVPAEAKKEETRFTRAKHAVVSGLTQAKDVAVSGVTKVREAGKEGFTRSKEFLGLALAAIYTFAAKDHPVISAGAVGTATAVALLYNVNDDFRNKIRGVFCSDCTKSCSRTCSRS